MQAAWVNRVQALWPHPEEPELEFASLSELCDALR
jgi:putative hydrolase of the HAD superfamily